MRVSSPSPALLIVARDFCCNFAAIFAIALIICNDGSYAALYHYGANIVATINERAPFQFQVQVRRKEGYGTHTKTFETRWLLKLALFR